MYASVAFALRNSHDFLAFTTCGYRKNDQKVKQKALNEHNTCEIRFAIGQDFCKVHASKRKYCMSLSLKDEISSV